MKKCNNFVFIGKKEGPQKRGAYNIAKRFAEYNNFEFKEDLESRNLNFHLYDKIIYTYQNPNNYLNIEDPIKKRKDTKFLFYIRNPLYAKLCNSASNGFSYYCENKSHKNFIPYICDYPYNVLVPNEIAIGFYLRPHIIKDSFDFFIDFIKHSKNKINVVTCGNIPIDFDLNIYSSVNSWKHTYDTECFFNLITHYLCPMSGEKKDPFPNMLMEAVQTNKQIICPKLKTRNHNDGIDDILSMLLSYHIDLKNLEKEYQNINVFTSDYFQSFYKTIFENNWNNFLDYKKYKTFYDWCSKEI